ncbi:Peptide chain release factor 2 [Capsicum baccatum]|uniref:Peptide chain release factor 2 n=1 Tax=Capsicum baccatum TaxID=33114 RepID=A0A2G2VGA8_CAPBA|nr:Peptide chain release factor 2 [Capsicum baccatum]
MDFEIWGCFGSKAILVVVCGGASLTSRSRFEWPLQRVIVHLEVFRSSGELLGSCSSRLRLSYFCLVLFSDRFVVIRLSTSFSGVEVMPLLPEDSTDVEIPEEDLDISFTRAGGKGGQNVNKVETAVRITHIPTGVAVRCTEERTQLANKIKALSRLKAKLLVIAEEQRACEIKQIRGNAVKAEWGQQIRNYVFHPYKLVKDVRTAYETSDITSVMDGELDPFIKAYLKHKYGMTANPSGLS